MRGEQATQTLGCYRTRRFEGLTDFSILSKYFFAVAMLYHVAARAEKQNIMYYIPF